MMNIMGKAIHHLTTALAVMLMAMVVMICVGVALRYIWGESLLWLDETLVFAMIAMVFLAAIGVSQSNQHLRMTLLTQNLSRSVAHGLGLVEQAVTMAVCLFVSWYSYQGISRLYARGTLSNMAEIPLWLVQGTVLVGLIGMAGVAFLRLVHGLRHWSGAK